MCVCSAVWVLGYHTVVNYNGAWRRAICILSALTVSFLCWGMGDVGRVALAYWAQRFCTNEKRASTQPRHFDPPDPGWLKHISTELQSLFPYQSVIQSSPPCLFEGCFIAVSCILVSICRLMVFVLCENGLRQLFSFSSCSAASPVSWFSVKFTWTKCLFLFKSDHICHLLFHKFPSLPLAQVLSQTITASPPCSKTAIALS